MTAHRATERAGRRRRRFGGRKLAEVLRVAVPQLTSDGRFIVASREVTLAGDHEWQGVPCLICWTTPGSRPVRAIVVMHPFAFTGSRHMLACSAFLVCGDHPPVSAGTAMTIAAERNRQVSADPWPLAYPSRDHYPNATRGDDL